MDDRQTFRDVGEESQYFKLTQLTKYTHVYSITLQMPMARAVNTPTFLEPILQVMEDADFHITHICGSVTSPTDVNGVRVEDHSSALDLFFPMAGAVNPVNRSDRGLSFRFIDPKDNRRLSEGRVTRNTVDLAAMSSNVLHSYLEFGSVIGPGYDYGWGKLVPFNYTLPRSTRFKVQLQCVDGRVASQLYSRVSFAFVGNRYE